MVPLIYAVFAALWILFSDTAVEAWFSNPEKIIRASMLKGWLFVAVTTLLLYGLIQRQVARLNAAHRSEMDAYQQKQRSLDLLSAIADNSEDAIFAKDTEGRYLLFNQAASRIVGKPAAEVLGHDDRAIFPPDQAEMLMSIDCRIMNDGHTETNEEILDTAIGTCTFLSIKGALRDAEKRIFGVFGIVRDITARKQTEEDLRASDERLRLLIEHAPVALAMFDRDMRYLAASRRWLDDFGLGTRDLIGLSHYAVFPEIDAALKAIHQRGLAGEVLSNDAAHFRRADGQEQWLRWEMRPWRTAEGAVGGIVIFSEDITARKQAELALSASEMRFHDIVTASADWIWEVDAQARYTYASESVEELLGYVPAEVLGKTPFDLMSPEEAARVGPLFAEIAARRIPFRDLDNTNRHKDGSLRHVQTNGMPMFDAQGEFIGYRGLDRDVTEKKLADQALVTLANNMATTLNAIPDLLFEIDAEGRYLAVRAAKAELLAAPEAELIGRTVSEVMPAAAAEGVMAALAAARQDGTNYGQVIELPLAMGTRYFELSVARKLTAADVQPNFIVISRDITERQAAEAELNARNDELERFNLASIGREMDMIALKQQINALSKELGRDPPFPLAFLDEGGMK